MADCAGGLYCNAKDCGCCAKECRIAEGDQALIVSDIYFMGSGDSNRNGVKWIEAKNMKLV